MIVGKSTIGHEGITNPPIETASSTIYTKLLNLIAWGNVRIVRNISLHLFVVGFGVLIKSVLANCNKILFGYGNTNIIKNVGFHRYVTGFGSLTKRVGVACTKIITGIGIVVITKSKTQFYSLFVAGLGNVRLIKNIGFHRYIVGMGSIIKRFGLACVKIVSGQGYTNIIRQIGFHKIINGMGIVRIIRQIGLHKFIVGLGTLTKRFSLACRKVISGIGRIGIIRQINFTKNYLGFGTVFIITGNIRTLLLHVIGYGNVILKKQVGFHRFVVGIGLLVKRFSLGYHRVMVGMGSTNIIRHITMTSKLIRAIGTISIRKGIIKSALICLGYGSVVFSSTTRLIKDIVFFLVSLFSTDVQIDTKSNVQTNVENSIRDVSYVENQLNNATQVTNTVNIDTSIDTPEVVKTTQIM